MNVYDFDGTLYKGDSSRDFFLYCLRNDLSLLRFLPRQALGAFLYCIGKIDKTAMKEMIFSFLCGVEDVRARVESFWDSHRKNIFPYYLNQSRQDDVVVSASPEFLLRPICARLGISAPIASEVDEKTGKFLSSNCHDAEKTRRFYNVYGDVRVNNFYSDSHSDLPMAKIASAAFLISARGEVRPWNIENE